MWENSVRRRFWRNIILAVLSGVIIVGLVIMLNRVKQESEINDAALSEISVQKKEEQDASVAQSYQSIQDEFNQDLATVRQYVPGIVCWGDTLTRGSSGNTSYTDVLQTYIDSEICDCYDFSEKLQSSVTYTGLNSDDYVIDIPVVNMGGGDENSDTILGRAGVENYRLRSSIVIPADCTPVVVKLLDSDLDTEVTPLTVGDSSLNPVTIAGVEGTLTLGSVDGYSGAQYAFTRSVPGAAQTVEAGTELICSNANQYQDYIHIIWIGTYDSYYTADTLVQRCKTLLARQTANTDRYLIISPCSMNNNWERYCSKLDDVDAAMLREFGDHYISLRKYLVSDGLADAGITASSDDKKASLQGAVPDSLRSANGSMEFSSKVYELLGKLVYERMDKLGYFSEIRTELNIKAEKAE